MNEIQILGKKLEREKKAREILENMIETRTRELYLADKKLEKERDNLKERTKELDGLYNLGKLTEQFEDLEELFHRFLKEVVPPSMQFPDETFSKIEFDGEKYLSFGEKDLCTDNDCLSAPIVIRGEKRGKLCVGHTEDLPFIKKFEQNLIDGYSERLGKIIERNEAEEALRDAEQKWISLTRNTNDTILIADKNDIVEYINKTIPPETPEEVIGKSVYEYVIKEHHDVMRKSLKKVYKTGESDSYEVTLDMSMINPKMGTLWFNTKVVPIKTDEGISGVIMIATDITERMKLEKEQIKSSNIEAINNLIVTINHEMNQPLSVITSNAGYLMEEIDKDSKVYEDAKLINDEAWKLAKLVKKIRNIKEIKTTEYSQGSKMIDLNDIDEEEKNE